MKSNQLINNFQIQSVDGSEIKTYLWNDTKKPKAVIHLIATGTESVKSYSEFAKRMNKQNIIVVCSEQRGFSKSKKDKNTQEDNVFFSYFNGWQLVVEDLKSVNNFIKKTYKHLPLYLVGHSLATVFAKAYAIKYSETIDGLIFSSFIEFNLASLLSNNLLLLLIELFSGKKYACNFKKISYLNNFTKVMKKYRNIENDDILEKYIDLSQDPLLSKTFTVSALRDVYKCMLFNSYVNNIKFIRQDLPILILANNNEYKTAQRYTKMSETLLKTLLKNDCFAHYVMFNNTKDKVFSKQVNKELEDNINLFIDKYNKKYI
ncbi:alpha/beta hydrolase [Mycoplasma yeatsii]|uniref:Alpha-beta hydrolase superfamily lysophospholipase n=1 Tax=Mycoplasma yeatsii TaxID=51365 RepID=A0ABU0NDM1_9MOLU|nr:alpha/beta fold hydrolase [Mycoplasma yeatsii]MDQ0567484.1 alpha-beta hydrolase superfamily lysophospholipase [Mycoplasma yeatsii]